MAFGASPGWQNLAGGSWSPVIYSQKVLNFFRTQSVVEDITNTDYSGEINDFGDTVKIIKEPTVILQDLKRGTMLDTQWLDDDEITLVVDQGKAFKFAVDDIEKKQSHVNWESMATNAGAYALKNNFDTNILQYIFDNAATSAGQVYGTSASPNDTGHASGEITPLKIMNRASRLLDDLNVPTEGRWFVASPIFWEEMQDENSKLLSTDYAMPTNIVRNGRIIQGEIRGFAPYKSNNMPNPTATQFVWLAGHKSAVATATQLADVESFRSQDFFGDVVRAKHVYGRKLLRSEAVVHGHCTFD